LNITHQKSKPKYSYQPFTNVSAVFTTYMNDMTDTQKNNAALHKVC